MKENASAVLADKPSSTPSAAEDDNLVLPSLVSALSFCHSVVYLDEVVNLFRVSLYEQKLFCLA
jgi:hypothetical protein